MDPRNLNPAKEESFESGGGVGGCGPSGMAPRPMEGLHDSGPPPFLTKTYEVVDDPGTDRIVSWSWTQNSFVVWDPYAFSISVLPKYFKHNNISSFVRQLNTYAFYGIVKLHCALCLRLHWWHVRAEGANVGGDGWGGFWKLEMTRSSLGKGFRKVDPDRWEFANEGFLRGQKHLLKTIKRRRPPSHSPQQPQSLTPCLEVGQFGVNVEIDRLKRSKNILMAEMVKLRLEQQNTRAHLKSMEERIQGTEQKQQQMLTFLARAMRNPNFVQKLVQQKEKRKEIEAISEKRRRPIEHAPLLVQINNEVAQASREFYGYEDPELESLALEMQGFGSSREEEQQEEVDVELNDEFWEELLNEGIGEEKGTTDIEQR